MANNFMIEVNGLTKRYARHAAIDGLSFTVGRGEIVGFLGPNGAGKSTTMRILAGFMAATEGTARVAGFDVFRESEEVRRRIGYMPENNPLHLDMRVRDYLLFRARIKGIDRANARENAEDVLERCGLKEVSRRVIGHLSKGFRQRIGIADALVHDPELIILDEPTIGLDPHQIRAVRQLIKQLAGEHTVLISTHILPEVEMTCSRVLIMNQGRIMAADSTAELQGRMNADNQVVAEIAAPPAELEACWEELAEVSHFDISPLDGDYCRCVLSAAAAGEDLRPLVYAQVRARNWPLRELRKGQLSLEDIFVRITRGGRDPESEERV